MAAYKDATSQWRFRKTVRLPDGRSERISGTPNKNSRRDAEDAEREAIERLEHPERYPTAIKSDSVSFDAFTSEWLRTYPPATNRASTIVNRELHVRLHLIPYWQNTPLSEITAQSLMRFVADLRDKESSRSTTGVRKRQKAEPQSKLSAQTVKNVLSTLHKVLKTAVSWKKLTSMPEFPRVKVGKPEWDWLTRDEATLLLEAARDDEERALLLFALKTGARAGEQLAVEWGDIDFANKTVTLQRSLFKDVVGNTKNGKSRTIPLAPSLEGALKKVKHLRGNKIFCDQDGRYLPLWSLKTVLRRALRKAGLRQVRWHDLRHSFASQLVQVGVNLKQVSEWLGHSSIVITTRYAHLAPSDGYKLITLLDAKTG